MKTLAHYTIQCTHPDTGETGCWIYAGDSHKIPGSALSPLFKDQVQLYQWMNQNGWNDAKNGTWNAIEKDAPLLSELILGKDDCHTYVGEVANKLVTRAHTEEFENLIDRAKFTVLELLPDKTLICRAIQPTFILAAAYMTPDRVLVYARQLRQHLTK